MTVKWQFSGAEGQIRYKSIFDLFEFPEAPPAAAGGSPEISVSPNATVYEGENYVEDGVITTVNCTIDMELTDNGQINMTCPDVDNLSPSVVSGIFPRGLPQNCTCNVTDDDFFAQTSVYLINARMFESLPDNPEN